LIIEHQIALVEHCQDKALLRTAKQSQL